jgi:hypothetical protein
MGFRDEWSEWLAAFRWAILWAIVVASVGYFVWTVAAAWLYAGVFGALAVLGWFALEFGVVSVPFAPRRVVRVIAGTLLAVSLVIVGVTGFTAAGAMGVFGALTFFACDFALQWDENRIRIEKD